MKRIIYSIFCVCLALGTFSCSNDDDEPSMSGIKPRVQLKNLTSNGSIGLQLGYDAEGRYVSVSEGTGLSDVLTFSYSPFAIGGYFNVSDIRCTSEGYIRSFTVNEDGEKSYLSADYDQSKHLTRLTLAMDGIKWIMDLLWKDGLLMKTTESVEGQYEYSTYSYEMSYSTTSPDYNRLGQWSTILAQAVGQNDLCIPLTFCGFFGKAPDKFPSKVYCITTDRNGNSRREQMNFTYTFNPDGSLSTETADGVVVSYNY